MIVTAHIQSMLEEARRLAIDAKTGCEDFGNLSAEHERDLIERRCRSIERALERLENLAVHARAELADERLRFRDGWPRV